MVDVSFSPEIEKLDLEAEKEYQILRITQEALTNIRKHAESEEALIEVRIVDGRLRLSIIDQGKGFEVVKLRQEEIGFGYKTMRERAETIGGELSIQSAPGEGTILNIHVPISNGIK
jgi:signal transduction histidine kinase